jgi:hypothetical protein
MSSRAFLRIEGFEGADLRRCALMGFGRVLLQRAASTNE